MRFFNIILWQPLFNILVVLYLLTGNLGIAIILLTLLVRVALYPTQSKATKSQIAMQALQPKLKEIQRKYKDNKEEQAKETMALYKNENINPFSGFLVLFIQLPIFIALFDLFRKGITADTLKYLYNFIPIPGEINTMFLGVDLTQPYKIVGIIVAILFFLQVKLSMVKQKEQPKKGSFGDMFQKQMNYLFPVLIGFAMAAAPAALGLYLIVGTLFLIVQQHFVKQHLIEEENV